ncbi:hypothetical protein OE699_02885 [Sedimentimonas flavescens]|uniref:Uncharacterized protein n=1 Tax=Sedimentimonas flavescens TaxID=2851012 RepID=A0ABT2ZVL4_9RHOB|nr:hypothetical protein [Sedimentimonas flavescens]MCV2877786.1 hypothetical protein [Sedimentimonas flavescens]
MSTKGTLIRAYMAGAILALAVLCIVLAGFTCRRSIAAHRMKPRRSCQKTRREFRRRHHVGYRLRQTVTRVLNAKGDRVKIEMRGKYLQYRAW